MTVVTVDYGYLQDAYLVNQYLTGGFGAIGSMGMQANILIKDFRSPLGMQATIQVADFPKPLGMQASIQVLDFPKPLGMQANIKAVSALGMQAVIALYNTNLLRVLRVFPSRGNSLAAGVNAWGNIAGIGDNWKANSTAAGDFHVSNLNTDIVEQVWRSNATFTGVTLDCDTERPQGVFLDTFAMLGHNLTTSATINLLGANDSTFGSVGVVIPLTVLASDPNIIYIAPELPTTGYRYWRIAIDDGTNPDPNGLQIGTIIFGAGSLFFGECFVDEVDYKLQDYADSVNTEAFTNVSNSRAQKKTLTLEFRVLEFALNNFKLLRRIIQEDRTVVKTLWIPTPSATDQEQTQRFAVFAKLSEIPSERHKYIGGDADYVTLTVNLDESK